MIESVELQDSIYAPIPQKFEAGTPHVAGAVALHAALKETFEGINNVAVAIDWALDMTSKVITDPEEIVDAQARLQDDLMQRIDKAEQRKGRRISSQEMSVLLEVTKRDFVHSNNPNRSIYALGEVVQKRDGSLWRVYNFKENGSPMFTDNLEEKIKLESDDVVDEEGLTRKRK